MMPQRAAPALVIMLVLVCTSCATRQLSDFKQKLIAKDYAGVAAQTVRCETADDVCGQLHLIKGDACFRLAKQDDDAANHYTCAATELDKGIQYTKTWQRREADLNRPQTYANLCESLRALQDMARGSQAEQLTQRLLDTSQRFLAAEPGHPAAVYYNTSARYTQLQPALLQSPAPQGLCQNLNTLMANLEAARPGASGSVYQTPMGQLSADIDAAKRTIADCR